jgi:hypothetical protein
MNILRGAVDERFLLHRLKATSIASMAGVTAAMGLFAYHYWKDHVWNWELFSIGAVMALIKQGLMAWYRYRN